MRSEEIVDKSIHLKKWAVVGASPNPSRYSNKIVKLLKDRGYTVYPVRPAVDEIHGLKCYSRVSDLPEPVDVVDMVVNPDVGRRVMDEINKAGIKYVWLQPGAESPDIHDFARKNEIQAVDACVLAVLAINKDAPGN